MIRAVFLPLLLLLAAGGALAQSAQEAQTRLAAIKESLAQSAVRRAAFEARIEEADQEAESLSERLVQLGARLRSLDDESGRLERRLKDLAGMKRQLLDRLAQDQDSLVQLVAALERLGRRPAALSLFQPGSALDTARSVSLISGMVPMINVQAMGVRLDLESLLRVEAGMVSDRQSLTQTATRLTSTRAQLASVIQDRKKARRQAMAGLSAESARQSSLQAEAKDLESLLSELFSRTPQERPARPDSDALEGAETGTGPITGAPLQLMAAADFRLLKGQLVPPVSGETTLRFGQRDGVLKAKGEKRSARPGSEVLSPSDGRVVFSAPFRDFGEVLIIEHAEGYHSLLAGLSNRYADLGQTVLAGEPIGAMGNPSSTDVEGGRTGGRSRSGSIPVLPELYLELREKGQSVNPAPWYSK